MSRRAIWTIGYQGASVPSVMNALLDAKVELLADVRALPLSRRPGFSKSALDGAAQEAGIAYRHFKALGTPRDGREAARCGDYRTLEKIYSGQLLLPEAMAAAAELATIAAQKRTALICFCGDARHCHRSLLLSAMMPEFDPVHLMPRVD